MSVVFHNLDKLGNINAEVTIHHPETNLSAMHNVGVVYKNVDQLLFGSCQLSQKLCRRVDDGGDSVDCQDDERRISLHPNSELRCVVKLTLVTVFAGLALLKEGTGRTEMGESTRRIWVAG